MECQGRKVGVYLTLLQTWEIVSEVIVPFYTPSNNVWEFQLLYTLINT